MSRLSESHLAAHQDFSFYTSEAFFKQLTDDVRNSQESDQIGLMTMLYEPADPFVHELTQELSQAARRGAEVTMGIDAFTLLVEADAAAMGPLWIPGGYAFSRFRRRQQVISNLDAQPNIAAKIINAPTRSLSNPFAGRSHIKMAVVQDKVYVGGPNLSDSRDADMVIGWQDQASAASLYAMAREVVAERTTQALGSEDICLPISQDAAVLIDTGIPGQSMTMEVASNLTAEAAQWLVYAGQFFPDGRILDNSWRAYQRGVDAILAYNHPFNQKGLKKYWQALALARTTRQLSPTFVEWAQTPLGTEKLHAAGLASEKQAIKGSHNFHETGVRLGAAELSVHTRHAATARMIGYSLLTSSSVPLELPAALREPSPPTSG